MFKQRQLSSFPGNLVNQTFILCSSSIPPFNRSTLPSPCPPPLPNTTASLLHTELLAIHRWASPFSAPSHCTYSCLWLECFILLLTCKTLLILPVSAQTITSSFMRLSLLPNTQPQCAHISVHVLAMAPLYGALTLVSLPFCDHLKIDHIFFIFESRVLHSFYLALNKVVQCLGHEWMKQYS